MYIIIRVFDFGFFIQWNINLQGLLNARVILAEEQQWSYLIHT